MDYRGTKLIFGAFAGELRARDELSGLLEHFDGLIPSSGVGGALWQFARP